MSFSIRTKLIITFVLIKVLPLVALECHFKSGRDPWKTDRGNGPGNQ